MILLQADSNNFSFLLIGISVVIGLLGWLLSNMFKENKDKIARQADELEILKRYTQEEIRKVERTVNDLNINILDKLDDIKNKFYEFRKQS